jgi:glycosyltransferase involved in cell wall biosynthesis
MAKVHIIIPTYNRAYTIIDCINSVLEQTYLDWKLTIIDNNSSDDTDKVIKDNFKELINKKIFYNKFNKTVPIIENWNRAIAKIGNEKYFKLLWSDDILNKNFIKTAVDTLDQASDKYVGFCSALNYVDLQSKEKIRVRKYGFFGTEMWLSFFYKNYLGSPTPQLLKTRFFKSLKFDISNRYAADMIYAAEPYFFNKKFIYSNKPLATLQTSDDTETGKIFGSELMLQNRYDFRSHIISRKKRGKLFLKGLAKFIYKVEKLYFQTKLF